MKKVTYLDAGKHGFYEFELEEEDIPIAYHPGECTDGVEYVRGKDYIKKQLAELSDEFIIAFLTGFGYDVDSEDRVDLEQLIVFEAAAELTDSN